VQAARQDIDKALDEGAQRPSASIEFAENLRVHDKSVSPVLRFIRRHVEAGVDDPDWYEEQFNFLLGRIIRAEHATARLPERIDCVRSAKRQELIRRLSRATDFMHSNLHRQLTLEDIARAAHLSQFHFLRVFRQVHGMTPMSYLRIQRTSRALALLESTRLEIQEVAALVGLSRPSLWRAVMRASGRAPKDVRRMPNGLMRDA
jgi:AraC family transcriptional regulator